MSCLPLKEQTMSETTWILVAHRAGARLYSSAGKDQPLHLVESIPHPQGRLRNQDLDADTGGRSFDRVGHHRHAMGVEEEPTEHLAMAFAKKLADKLRNERVMGHCERIVLVAGPRLLGKLRDALDPATAKLVARELVKDFGELSDSELPAVLSKALA
jgi:protein required for attachment to host cells